MTVLTPCEQAMRASAATRIARSDYRRQVADGTLTLRELLADPIPACITTVRAFEIVGWPAGRTDHRSPYRLWLQRLNFAAIHNAVNIFEETGRLTRVQREWLVGWVEDNPALARRKVAA